MTPDIALVLGIIVVSFILFATERFPTDVIALGIVVTLILTGLLSTKDAFAGFGSDAVILILGMLIIAASLTRTGVVELVGQYIYRVTGDQPKRILAVIMTSAAALGSVMSHTGSTAFFLPITIRLAERARVSASRYLMPLAFATMLAGSVTLIATSTNIVVSGVITQYGLAPLGMFEMTPVGLPILIAGLLYMYLIGSRLIPDRAPVEDTGTQLAQRLYITEIIIQPNSLYVGKPLVDESLGDNLNIQVLRIVRDRIRYLAPSPDVALQAGDVLLVECERSEILKVKNLPGLDIKADVKFMNGSANTDEVKLVEVILTAGSPFIGRTLRGLHARERYGLQVLAVDRRGELIRQKLSTIRMQLGDVLLIQGERASIDVLERDGAFRILNESLENERPDLRRAPRAVLIFVGVLVISALNIVPVSVVALGGAVLAFATRCITPEEAYRLVQWKVLIMVGAMLALGRAMEQTGTAAYLAQQVINAIGTASPVTLLAVFFGLTVALTPLSNSTAAIVMLPVAIRTAQGLALDPRSFVITIAIAATNGYITPLDHITVMVYGPGHYHFTDFVRVGALLTVLIFVLVILLVPIFWPRCETGVTHMENSSRPLADRIRPDTLEEFIGQEHLVGEGKPLYQVIKRNRVHSMIFWGPPGVGKTTLARIIAHSTGRAFYELSAVSAGKDEVRKIVEGARREEKRDLFSMNDPQKPRVAPVLFLDEIHRFNKAQQDFLLPYIEDGTIILIGATTENPSFEVIPALLSRAQVFVLRALTEDDVRQIVQRGAQELGVTVPNDAAEFLVSFANGDGRQALNLLEATAALYEDAITLENLTNALQSRHLRYDKQAEEHYDTISAFIKSMRASQVDAALYYLARMVDGGEDPTFIARRMVIFASEDVGMADPKALTVANEVFRAVEVIGYPECQFNLAEGVAYLASAPKDRSAGDAYFKALDDVKQQGNLPIPLKLRNAPTRLMKELGYGEGYSMYGDDDLLPDKLRGTHYYKT